MSASVLDQDGVLPDCAWHEGALWVAVRLGDPRVPGLFVLYRDSLIAFSVDLPAGTPTYPVIHSFDGTLWTGWSVNGAGTLLNVTTGARVTLSPCENNRPIVLGFGFCAWQGAQRDGWPITRVRLDSGVQSVGGVGSGTGLSRVDRDGAVYTVDLDRHAFAGATIPCWSGDLVVGEAPTGGVRWQLAAGQQGTLWHATTTFEPRCAVDGDRYAIVTAGAPHGVRVWRGTRAALIATMTAPVDPPPPPPPPPPPVDDDEDKEPVMTAMALPADAHAIVVALHAAHPTLANGTDAQRRELAGMIAQTVRARKGPKWGWKSAHGLNEVRAKDAIAFLGDQAFRPNERQHLFIWDLFNGTTRQPNAHPVMSETEHTDQFFVPVEPFDYLGTSEPGPIDPPPPPPPPPPVGDFVTKAQMQAAIAALQAAMRSEFNAALLEMRAALEREIAASGGVSANTVDVLIAKALSQLVVVGSTARVFSHAHSFTAQVTRKP